MDSNPQFEPIFPAHAIERCGATVTFSEPLPTKAFQRVVDGVQRRFRNAGLEMIGGTAAPPGAVGIQVDMASGQATPITTPLPAVFATADRASQFVIAPNSLTARTNSYVRWEPFAGQMEELLLPAIANYSDVVSVVSVQIDYVDRFVWTGDWSNFDWRKLLRTDGKFIASHAAEHRQWHTHSGWFESATGRRRLVNVNIDLSDYRHSESLVPSIAILTLMRHDLPDSVGGGAPVPFDPAGGPVVRLEDAASVQGILEELHNELKTLLGQVITDSMARRISLYAKASDDVRAH
jgi:uncharacterized protein (TIGR04255 family)